MEGSETGERERTLHTLYLHPQSEQLTRNRIKRQQQSCSFSKDRDRSCAKGSKGLSDQIVGELKGRDGSSMNGKQKAEGRGGRLFVLILSDDEENGKVEKTRRKKEEENNI